MIGSLCRDLVGVYAPEQSRSDLSLLRNRATRRQDLDCRCHKGTARRDKRVASVRGGACPIQRRQAARPLCPSRGIPMLRTILVALIAFSCLASSAQANEWWTNESPATDPRSKVMRTAVASYYERILPGRIAEKCPNGLTLEFGEIFDPTVFGYGENCWAMLNAKLVAKDYRLPRSFYKRGGKSLWAAGECKAWTHEIGHAIGLTHDDVGLVPEMHWMGQAHPSRECWEAVALMYPRDSRHVRPVWTRDLFG